MHFPLGILTDCFQQKGIDVLKAPAHSKKTFDWVTCVPDEGRKGASPDIIPMVAWGTPATPSRAAAPRIVVADPTSVNCDGFDIKELASEDILIQTDLPLPVLADDIQRLLLGIISWNDAMADMIDEDCINLDLLKASESMIGCYIGLSDSAFAHIAHTIGIDPPDEVSQYFIKNKHYPPDAIRDTTERGAMKRWEVQDWTVTRPKGNNIIPYPTINRVIKRNGAYAAHLLLVSPEPITATTQFLFDLLADKVRICLRRHWRRENPLDQRYSYFLEEVFKGNLLLDDRFEERAALYGIPATGTFEVCIAGAVWRAGSSQYLAKHLMEREPRCNVLVEDQDVIVLLAAHEGEEGLIGQMEDSLCEAARELGVELGISEPVDRLESASVALEEARAALKYGTLYSNRYLAFDESKDARTRTLFRFRRYFPYCALDQFEDHSKLVSAVMNQSNPLLKLKAADEKRGSTDFQILRTYLYFGGRINRVCETHHMHRNTVLYRLEKIRTILGCDIDDSDVRQYLRTLYFLMP